jgi:hypothetical protein
LAQDPGQVQFATDRGPSGSAGQAGRDGPAGEVDGGVVVQDGDDVGPGQDGRQLEGQLRRVGAGGQLTRLGGLAGGPLES